MPCWRLNEATACDSSPARLASWLAWRTACSTICPLRWVISSNCPTAAEIWLNPVLCSALQVEISDILAATPRTLLTICDMLSPAKRMRLTRTHPARRRLIKARISARMRLPSAAPACALRWPPPQSRALRWADIAAPAAGSGSRRAVPRHGGSCNGRRYYAGTGDGLSGCFRTGSGL